MVEKDQTKPLDRLERRVLHSSQQRQRLDRRGTLANLTDAEAAFRIQKDELRLPTRLASVGRGASKPISWFASWRSLYTKP